MSNFGIFLVSSHLEKVKPAIAYIKCYVGNWYHDEVVIKLQAAGQSTDGKHVDQSLFYCHDGGYINYVQYCGSCVSANRRADGDYSNSFCEYEGWNE